MSFDFDSDGFRGGSWKRFNIERIYRRVSLGQQSTFPTLLLACCALLCAGHLQITRAQQTLFSVPTTDVLARGQIYTELDISFKPTEPKSSAFVPRIVFGAGHRIEVGLNITGNVQPGVDHTTVVPALKWKIYDGGENGWSVVMGNNFFAPVRQRTYHAGNYAYAEFGKKLRTGTRLTAGAYHFTKNVVAPDAQRAGGQFGFEQPVNKRLSLQADWFTGQHANGYFTSGVAYKLTQTLTTYFAYSLGNSNLTHGNHFFYAEVGYNFN